MNSLYCRMVLLSFMLLLTVGSASANETIIRTGNDQPIAATLTFEAASLTSMTEIPFKLAIKDKQMHIESAACALTMPAMKMPNNHPKLNCTNNNCSGKAIFTMAGAWQSTFGLIFQDGSHSSIVFDIDMVKMK